MRGVVTRKLVSRLSRYAVAGLTLWTGTIADSGAIPYDLRIDKLKTFFSSYGCPTPQHAMDYVQAADVFQLDYRVLPAISVLESTCGINGRMNNYWGWNSAESAFASVPEGIAFIASRLAAGEPYRDKTLDQKLRTYNPLRLSYARNVKRLMRRIESEPPDPDPIER